MINRIKCRFENVFISIKSLIANNYVAFVLFLGAIILALLFSVIKLVSDLNEIESVNIVVRLIAKDYSIGRFILRTFLINAVFALLLFLSCLHYYLYLGSFLGLGIAVYFFTYGYLASVFTGGFAGIISFLLYFLPLSVIILLNYFVSLIRILDVAGTTCKGKHFINFVYYKGSILKIILKGVLINTIFIILYSFVAFLIISAT